MADRARPTRAVHARVPESRKAPDQPAAEPREPEVDLSELPGREAVKAAYEVLPAGERGKSLRALSAVLAEPTGLSQGTVRVYLSELRAAERAAIDTVDTATTTALRTDKTRAAHGGNETAPERLRAPDQDHEIDTWESTDAAGESVMVHSGAPIGNPTED